jgi:hypothetical protein
MGHEININGFIEGISEESFDLIKEDLEDVFEEVSWKDNTIEIYSFANHQDEVLRSVFDKLAFCIDGDGGGQIDLEGEECVDLSSIFFKQRQWKQEWAKISHPVNPFINGAINLTFSATAYVHVNPSILEAIRDELHGWAKGDTNVCITRDELNNRLAEKDVENLEIFQLMKTLQSVLTRQVADIVFHT